jgi:hypothetical protein
VKRLRCHTQGALGTHPAWPCMRAACTLAHVNSRAYACAWTSTRQFTSVRVRVDKHMRTRVTHLLPRQSHLMNLRQQQRARVTMCVRSNPTSPTRSCQQHPSHLPMSPPHPPRRQQMRPSRTHHAAASQGRRHPRSVATWNTMSPLVLCHRGLLVTNNCRFALLRRGGALFSSCAPGRVTRGASAVGRVDARLVAGHSRGTTPCSPTLKGCLSPDDDNNGVSVSLVPLACVTRWRLSHLSPNTAA